MNTKYIKSLAVTFNPLSPKRAHRLPRIVLAFLPGDARNASGGAIKISQNVLPSSSTNPSGLILGFKDGKEMKFIEQTRQNKNADGSWDLSTATVKDVIEEVNRHSRILARKEELGG